MLEILLSNRQLSLCHSKFLHCLCQSLPRIRITRSRFFHFDQNLTRHRLTCPILRMNSQQLFKPFPKNMHVLLQIHIFQLRLNHPLPHVPQMPLTLLQLNLNRVFHFSRFSGWHLGRFQFSQGKCFLVFGGVVLYGEWGVEKFFIAF